MSEFSQNKDTKNDEIDLLDLFRRMGKTLNNWMNIIGRTILMSIVFLLKRWIPLGISIIVGIGASVLIKTRAQAIYTSDMVIRCNTISNTDMMIYISRLHNYCAERNIPALSEALSLDIETAKNIVDINTYWIIEDRKKGTAGMVDYTLRSNAYDTITSRMIDRIDIRVKTKTPYGFINLKNGIISFIKKDSVFQKKNRVRLTQSKDLLTRLNYDIQQLDSLQKIKYFQETKTRQPQNGGQMIFLQEQKTQLIYTDIYALYARKQALESERDLYPDIITVLSDFNVPVKPENEIFYYGKKIIPVCFVLTLTFLILFEHD